MSFLHYEHQFKLACAEIKNQLLSKNASSPILSEDVSRLLTPYARGMAQKALKEGAEALTVLLNTRKSRQLANTEPARTRHLKVLNDVSEAFTGLKYRELQRKWKSPARFNDIFRDVRLASDLLSKKTPSVIPFPEELKSFAALKPWQASWDACAKTTDGYLFIPPLPPATCFVGNNHTFKFYRHTDEELYEFRGTTYVIQGGRAVVVKDRCGNNIASVAWTWKTNFDHHYSHLPILTYSLKLKSKTGWIRAFFEIRARSVEPPFIYEPLLTIGDTPAPPDLFEFYNRWSRPAFSPAEEDLLEEDLWIKI